MIDSNNSRLEHLGMKIQSSQIEQDGSEWLGLVNMCKDDAAKKSTHLTVVQLEYFKLVVSLSILNLWCCCPVALRAW